jgi:inner membrane protein
MFWGALAMSIPDIDFIASAWLNTSEDLLAHRAFTHSLLFALLVVPLFAAVANRVHQPHDIPFRKWMLFFAVEVLGHLLIDGFNNYGVGWLEPFSHRRFSFNTIYVADAFFSLWPGIAFVMLLILNRFHPKRVFWWRFGIFIPLFYLGYATWHKLKIDHDVKEIFALQHIPHEKYFTTPAPLQNWLWYVVSGNDSGYYIGFRSVFDKKKEINFQYFPRNDSLLTAVADRKDVRNLRRFSQRFYTVEKWGDTLVFNDLRFGQIIGWQDPRERFVFHYFLSEGLDNKLVVQRGRFAGWNKHTFKTLWERIKGN